VLYVPTFDHNLFSTPTVYEKGITSTGNDKQMTFEKNGHVVLMAVKRERSFVLCIKQREVKHEKYEKCCAARTGNLRKWHERFGHIHVDAIREMARTKAVNGLQLDKDEKEFFCEMCIRSK